jgi:phospholipid-binding lipoprotein MlaA
LGALDPATEIGIAEHDEDFGQTLAVWGVPSGPYVELPLLGPSTVRDTFSRVGDAAMDPLTYIGAGTTTAAVKASERPLRIVDARSRFGNIVDQALYESDDSYSTVKNAYLQRRRAAILNGQVTRDILPAIYQESEPF